MGKGSLYFHRYYAACTILYFGMAVFTYSVLSTVTSSCREKCPLLLPGSPSSDDELTAFSACRCRDPDSGVQLNAFGWLQDGSEVDPQKRFTMARMFQDSGLNCFICKSATSMQVFEPCANFGDCTEAGVEGFRPVFDTSSAMCFGNLTATPLQSPQVSLRQYTGLVLYFVASCSLLMSIAAAACTIGYWNFIDKYENDWLKLSRTENFLGMVCKVAPTILRIANIFALFFIILGISMLFGFDVCRYDLNEFGWTAFYDTTSVLLFVLSAAWLVICCVGSNFNQRCHRDTPFETPRIQRSKQVSEINQRY